MLTVPTCVPFRSLRTLSLRITELADTGISELVDAAARAECEDERKECLDLVMVLSRIRILAEDNLPGLEDDEPEGDEE